MKSIITLMGACMGCLLIYTTGCQPSDPGAEKKPAEAVTPAAVTKPAETAEPAAETKPTETVVSAESADGQWLGTMDKAIQQAGKDGKDLFIYFSGSDWSDWCAKLEEEILSTDLFMKKAPEHYVMVKLDFPKEAQLPPEQKEHNTTWQKNFGVKIFPTIILADASGKPYGLISYTEEGAEAFMEKLQEIREKGHNRLVLIAKAAEQKGLEKVKTLGKALDDLEDDIVFAAYTGYVDTIITNDPQNKTGYPTVYKVKQRIKGMQKYMNSYFPGMPARGRQDLDRALEELKPTGKALQQLLAVKAITYLMEENRIEAKKTMLAAIAAAPGTEHAQMMKDEMDRLFGRFAMATSEVSKDAREQKWDEALKKVNALFEELKPEGENLQQLYIMKGQILLQKKDLQGAKAAFEAGLKVDPQSKMGEYITNMLEEQLAKSMEEQQTKPVTKPES